MNTSGIFLSNNIRHILYFTLLPNKFTEFRTLFSSMYCEGASRRE